MANKDHRVEITTGIGLISFPHVFPGTATTNDDGEKVYDCQIIIPKSQKEDLRNILRAIKEVGEAKWGANWKSVRSPLRDGDKEKDELAEDGTKKGDKYPERLGCYFLNARSKRPIGVFDRERRPIHDESQIYGGIKGKIHVTMYPYIVKGNQGIAAGLNGLQKVADGDPMGGGAPSVESMFDLVDDEDLGEDLDLDLDGDDVDEDLEDAKPGKKTKAKNKAKGKPSEKTTAKTAKKSKKVQAEADPEDDFDDLDDESDLDDEYDDL